ncbi:hypothetical protein SAMD00024442_1_26 [Candidatus Symbiothrix dinenymphae]|nr:hypothetical protein SAMD00024442_1_26 [Candidatus Symbiothrix dinenymphae]
MTRKLILFVVMMFIFGGVNPAVAQQKGGHERGVRIEKNKELFQKLKAERIDYIAKKMDLTEDEKAKFSPIDAELQQKKFDLHKSLLVQRDKDKELTDDERKQMVAQRAESKKKEAELDEEYTNKMLEVLPAAKVAKYAAAAQSFNKKANSIRKEVAKKGKVGAAKK